MIGISVSMYDKFDDLGILLDIIRYNWKDEYYISVCSNHPNAVEKVYSYRENIDNFTLGAQISADTSLLERHRQQKFLLRVNDTIRRAMEGALAQDDVEYIVHLHADAWPLSEHGIKKLIREMDEVKASMAFKTRTQKFLNHYPPGHFMDQFMIFDATEAKNVNLFDRDIFDYPPGIHSHRLLPMICLIKFGWGKLYHYSDRSEEILWDGTSTLDAGVVVRPMMYNPEYDQLHVAREAFTGNLGKSLQARYLKTNGIKNGDNIDELIENYYLSEEEYKYKFDKYITDINKQLRWFYGLDSTSLERATRYISEYRKLDFQSKIKQVFIHNFDMLAKKDYSQYKHIFNDKGGEDRAKDVDLHEYYAEYFESDHMNEQR